ncbi:unnamed protein product [Closterium sp. NIES-65]|nr:unnamed protein product [Closterium sp. NIES-65]
MGGEPSREGFASGCDNNGLDCSGGSRRNGNGEGNSSSRGKRATGKGRQAFGTATLLSDAVEMDTDGEGHGGERRLGVTFESTEGEEEMGAGETVVLVIGSGNTGLTSGVVMTPGRTRRKREGGRTGGRGRGGGAGMGQGRVRGTVGERIRQLEIAAASAAAAAGVGRGAMVGRKGRGGAAGVAAAAGGGAGGRVNARREWGPKGRKAAMLAAGETGGAGIGSGKRKDHEIREDGDGDGEGEGGCIGEDGLGKGSGDGLGDVPVLTVGGADNRAVLEGAVVSVATVRGAGTRGAARGRKGGKKGSAAEDQLPFWAADSFSFPYITPATPLLTRGSTRKRFFAADLSVAADVASSSGQSDDPAPGAIYFPRRLPLLYSSSSPPFPPPPPPPPRPHSSPHSSPSFPPPLLKPQQPNPQSAWLVRSPSTMAFP